MEGVFNIKLIKLSNNFHKLTLDLSYTIEMWFSYEILIAFKVGTIDLHISENVWGKTTGKHLNMIDDDKNKRIPHQNVLNAIELYL